MAVISLAGLHNQLRISEYTLSLSDNIVSTRSVGGQFFTAPRGPRLWQGSMQFSTWTHSGQNRLEALISQIQIPGNYFNFTPKKANVPANYKGSGFGLVQTDGTQTAGQNLKLKGLPANFQLLAGDFLSFVIAGSNRLYRIAADATVASTGLATVKLEHPLSPGALPPASTPVTMVNPLLTAQYVPGSFQTGSIGLAATSGCSFSFVQAIRV